MQSNSDRWDWECTSTDPGVAADPAQLEQTGPAWIAADVPGTVAGALRRNGAWRWGVADTDVLDGRDWWFRCRFADPGDPGPWQLNLRGLATIADVWLNGAHLLHSENMFVEQLAVGELQPTNQLCIRFAALHPVLAQRRPRPRWKSRLIRHQNQRWIRTTMLGRMDGWSAWAAPVGPGAPSSSYRSATPRASSSRRSTPAATDAAVR